MLVRCGQFLLAPVPLHINHNRRATRAQEFSGRHRERDQQNLVYPRVKRRRHLAEQHPGRLNIQLHRQLPGVRSGIGLGPHRRQRDGHRGHLPPGGCQLHDFRVACVLNQQRRPPGKRRSRRRQHQLLPTPMLSPGDIEVFQQNSPRHPVNGQVMNDRD